MPQTISYFIYIMTMYQKVSVDFTTSEAYLTVCYDMINTCFHNKLYELERF